MQNIKLSQKIVNALDGNCNATGKIFARYNLGSWLNGVADGISALDGRVGALEEHGDARTFDVVVRTIADWNAINWATTNTVALLGVLDWNTDDTGSITVPNGKYINGFGIGGFKVFFYPQNDFFTCEDCHLEGIKFSTTSVSADGNSPLRFVKTENSVLIDCKVNHSDAGGGGYDYRFEGFSGDGNTYTRCSTSVITDTDNLIAGFFGDNNSYVDCRADMTGVHNTHGFEGFDNIFTNCISEAINGADSHRATAYVQVRSYLTSCIAKAECNNQAMGFHGSGNHLSACKAEVLAGVEALGFSGNQHYVAACDSKASSYNDGFGFAFACQDSTFVGCRGSGDGNHGVGFQSVRCVHAHCTGAAYAETARGFQCETDSAGDYIVLDNCRVYDNTGATSIELTCPIYIVSNCILGGALVTTQSENGTDRIKRDNIMLGTFPRP